MIPIKNQIIKLAGLTLACSVLLACDPEFDNPVGDTSSYSNGDADFTTYLAIGDSLTAGYADSALYINGQQNSFPNILANQFNLVGGGAFTQPLMDDNLGGLLLGGSPLPDSGSSTPGKTRYVLNAAIQSPERIAGTPSTELHPALNQNPLSGPFNNMGIPGAKSFHLLSPGYGALSGIFDVNTSQPVSPATANPYYIRFATSATASVLTDALAVQPTFFTIWVGNNDVLAYAADGGYDFTTGNNAVDQNTVALVDAANPLNPANLASYQFSDITHTAVFTAAYQALVGTLTATYPNAKGALINIPDISTIPYFTRVPYNPVPLDAETAGALNTAYAAYNGGLAQLQQASVITAEELAQRTISFSAGQNAVVIMDEDLTDLTGINPALINMRQATATDLLVLTSSSKIGTESIEGNPSSLWGIGVPLEDGDVLIPSEITAIETARQAYNTTIQAMADASPNLVFVDSAQLMLDIQDGYAYGTGYVDSTYATGGAFSLDGIHPTARGYAVVANTIISTINSSFNANIPLLDPGAYSTIFVK